MKVYNLTDQAKSGKDPSPQVVKIEGKEIRPGSKVEVGHVNLAKVSGMIYSGKIAIDKVPEWYVRARRHKRRSVPREQKVDAPRNRGPVIAMDHWVEKTHRKDKDETE
mgnify:CR=1 FL=1